ncbi:MAG: hypothetical protein ABI068_08150 [Ktedonobacterales bacterium]
MASVIEELHNLIDSLPAQDQERALTYVRELAQQKAPAPRSSLPPGTPPEVLLRITVSPEVGEALTQAFEASEHIDAESWNLDEYRWK